MKKNFFMVFRSGFFNRGNFRLLPLLLLLSTSALQVDDSIQSSPSPIIDHSNEQSKITGKVIYAGGKVQNLIQVIKDEHTCGTGHMTDESLYTSEAGGLQWAVVSIISELGAIDPSAHLPLAVLNQNECTFSPHVVLVGVNEPLVIKNNDPTLHNVRTVSFINEVYNRAQLYIPGMDAAIDTAYFTEPEIIETVCDVHGWMKAFVHVVDHPYHAVTNENGEFEISGLAPGKYTLRVWHEKLGTLERSIFVEVGSSSVADFEFKKLK